MTATYEVKDGKAVWNGRHLRDWVPVLVDRLVSQFDPVMIVLLGSVAQDSDGPHSDIDLLIVFNEVIKSELYDLLVDMRRKTQDCVVPTDFIVTSVSKLERRRNQPGTIEYESAHEGKVVYERRAA